LLLGARLRNWGFWAKDRVQGSPIGKHCEDIEALLASGAPSTDRLEELLHSAVEHTSFYAARRGFGSLQDFPVINKNTIKAQYEASRSDALPGVHLHLMSTSGSTGTPFSVLQDPVKRRRVLAEMICFGRRAGYQVGDRFVFTRIWTRHNRKRWHAALREIEGRREDFIYDTKDRLLSPSLVDLRLWPYTELKQFQFIQEAKGQYQLVLNGAKGHYRDEEFIELAKGFLGPDASVSVVHVDQIPLLAFGKFKLVVSRYRPSV
jgi:hypothetical protein